MIARFRDEVFCHPVLRILSRFTKIMDWQQGKTLSGENFMKMETS